MIVGYKNFVPFIDFGLGIVEKTIAVGDTITIWISSIYNLDDYTVNNESTPMDMVTEFQYTFTATEVGTFEFQISMLEDSITKTPVSNILTLTVE